MKIGFDGKRAVFNMTGLGNYSRTLIHSLSKYFPDNQYLLYTPGYQPHPRLAFLDGAENIGVHTPRGAMSRVLRPLWRNFLVGRELRNDGIQLFHGLSNELPYAVERSGVRSIVTIHDLIFVRYPELYTRIDRKIYRHKVEYACRVADRIVAVSEQTRQDLIGILNIDPGRIKVVYQSCDPIFCTAVDESRKQQVREKYKLPSQYLLYVGTIERRKNLLGVVKAMRQLKQGLDPHLVVIGRGRGYKQEVVEYVQSQQLNERVHFLSDVAFTDFPAIYQSAAAFVWPSLFEGFGIPITEALWSRCPVITSVGSCFAEAGGASSIYVPPENENALSQPIARVLEDNALADKMREEGYTYVQRFRDDRTAAALMGLYNDVVQS